MFSASRGNWHEGDDDIAVNMGATMLEFSSFEVWVLSTNGWINPRLGREHTEARYLSEEPSEAITHTLYISYPFRLRRRN